jgi:YebC/PmpR family DNA-binding regulatory protein
MSGHSKWAQIKRQKGANDAQRGQLFTKLAREIIIAARQGGPDPDANLRLRMAIQKARENNMPNDNIQRAITRATGGGDGAELQEIVYEAYGPSGTALLIQAATDNRNRTVSEIRSTLTRGGGTLGEAGSVSWNFESRGVITIPLDGRDADDVALQAIDAGADDVQSQGDSIDVYAAPARLEAVRRDLESRGIPVAAADVSLVPKTTVQLDEQAAIQTLRLVEKLEALDDVQKVYFNAEFAESVLAAYA